MLVLEAFTMKKAFTYLGAIILGAVLTLGAQRVTDRHPHLRRVLDELRDAKIELEHERHDWGGHRDRAIRAIEDARHEIVEVLKYER
jgi:hypothetical protein